MENKSGKSMIKLVIIIILIIVGTFFLVKNIKQMKLNSEEQDLRTNMLLMQAETKKALEEVCIKIVKLDASKEEDLNKINEIKKEHLKGIILNESPTEVQEAIHNVPEFIFDENCYYLDEDTLSEMGIKRIEAEKYGYFIVKYDFSTNSIEIVNTKGYNGNYTLTQINEDLYIE